MYILNKCAIANIQVQSRVRYCFYLSLFCFVQCGRRSRMAPVNVSVHLV